MNNKTLKLIECPRDAMQGIKNYIPAFEKVEYLNALLKVGFDVLDFGSFVSAKAVPQMADTKEVISQLNLDSTNTKLLAIIANTRGAEDAVYYEQISYLGFPFSISEEFQMRNTNKNIAESLKEVEKIQQLCISNKKKLVIYISMGFGNPYGDPYNPDIAINFVKKLKDLDIGTFSIADTIGVATPATISHIFDHLLAEFKDIEIGAHFHSTKETWEEKFTAAYASGCTSFDSAIKGIGGCPMAQDDLVGNIATESVISWCSHNNVKLDIDYDAFQNALQIAERVFLPEN